MADNLARSAAMANQVTAQKLPYLREAADPVSPLMGGVRQGMQIAQVAQEMELRAAALEAEQKHYADKLMASHAELDLRAKMAQVQAGELAVAQQRADTERFLADAQVKQTQQPGAALMRALLENPVRLNADGTADLATYDESGSIKILRNVSADHPEVRRHLDRWQIENDAMARRGLPGSPRGTTNLQALSDREYDIQQSLEDARDGGNQAEVERLADELGAVRSAMRGLLDTTAGTAGVGAPMPAARASDSRSGAVDPQRWGGNLTRQGRATAFLAKQDEPKAIINNSLINLLWKQYGFDSREDMVRAFDVLSERNPAPDPSALIEEWFRHVNSGDPKLRDPALRAARAAVQ